MLNRIVLLVVFALLFHAAFHFGQKTQKHKNIDADGYAAEWGCLQGAMYGCSALSDEGAMYACMDKAVEKYCPERAKRFKAFLSQSSSRVE